MSQVLAELEKIEIPLLISVSRPTIIKSAEAPFDFKEERKFKMIVSPEMVDLQEDKIRIGAIYKVLDIWINRDAPLLDIHSNVPCGKGLTWRPMEYNGYKAALVEGKIWDDYTNDHKVWDYIRTGKYGDNSIGGKMIVSKRVCDANKCYNDVSELELYEISIVPKGANLLANIIEKVHPTYKALENLDKVMNELIKIDNNFVMVDTMPAKNDIKKEKGKESKNIKQEVKKDVPRAEDYTPEESTVKPESSTEYKAEDNEEKPSEEVDEEMEEKDKGENSEEEEEVDEEKMAKECPCGGGNISFDGEHTKGCAYEKNDVAENLPSTLAGDTAPEEQTMGLDNNERSKNKDYDPTAPMEPEGSPPELGEEGKIDVNKVTQRTKVETPSVADLGKELAARQKQPLDTGNNQSNAPPAKNVSPNSSPMEKEQPNKVSNQSVKAIDSAPCGCKEKYQSLETKVFAMEKSFAENNNNLITKIDQLTTNLTKFVEKQSEMAEEQKEIKISNEPRPIVAAPQEFRMGAIRAYPRKENLSPITTKKDPQTDEGTGQGPIITPEEMIEINKLPQEEAWAKTDRMIRERSQNTY